MKQPPLSKIILVDLDGPLADLEGEFLKRWKIKFPGEFFVPFESRRSFFLRDEYPEHLKTKTEAILREDGFFADLSVIPGAKEAIAGLQTAWNIIFCTSDIFANPTALVDKRNWIRKHFGDDLARTMIFAKDKTLVRGDYLIDDRPAISGVLTPVWEQVVFDQPFNREVTDKKRIASDWSNWREVLDI